MAGGVRERICPLRSRPATALLEQRTQVESTVRVTALVRALVTTLRLRQISARFEEHPEVERGARMAQRIGFAIGELGAGHVASLFQQNPQAEPLDGRPGAIDRCMCNTPIHYAPCHPPAFPTVLSPDSSPTIRRFR